MCSLCYSACNAYAPCCHLWPVRLYRIFPHYIINDGPGKLVGIVTELRDGRDFPPVQTGPGAHPACCKMGTVSFPGGKVRPGRAAGHSPLSSAAVMEE